jgi:hypothetical protein
VTTFVLVPGAGGAASYWTRTAVELERRGHRAVAVDLPQDDPGLGLVDWASVVDDAIPPAPADTVLVAQSLGGFLAPLVRRPVGLIVLLNAMIPLPGESPDEWWDATGAGAAREAADRAAGHDSGFDLEWLFFADLDDAARAVLFAQPPRQPSASALASRCEFERWPEVPIRVLVGSDDRFFPPPFQRRVAHERLGLDVDAVPGGHLAAAANPAAVVDRLLAYLAR